MQTAQQAASQSQSNHKSVKALRLPKVLEKTGLSRTHVYRLIQANKFPKPIHLTERVSVWEESAIDFWLAEKFAA
jgi:prophage regulatory protein